MFLFCNEDKKKKERLNSVLKTTHNLIKKNDIKDVRKNPVYSLIRAMSNYHLYDIVRELYEDEEVTDVQSIYKDIGEHLINSDKLNNSKSFELGESNINIDLSKDAILVCAWNKERFVNALLNIGQNVGNLFEYDKINHMATYIYPIGLTIVYNGNHSTLSGILKGEGTIQANQTYDLVPTYSFFLADNADAVIDAGTDKVIFFHHATGKDAGFDLFAFSIADSKTYSWMFMLIAHRKAPFIVGVAAGTVKHPQATFDYSFLVVKVDYICHGFHRSNRE